MAYASLKECVDDLTTAGKLRVVDATLDCDLEVAAVHRRVFQAGGPALLFRNARGSSFPLVSNLFGTKERAYYILRHGLEAARTLLAARLSPADMARHPLRAATLPAALVHALPRFVKTGPALEVSGRVADLPHVRAWPRDGGPFITLPQVYTEDPDTPGRCTSNLGHVSHPARGQRRTSPSAKSGCTIRSIAASACTTRRRCARGRSAARERVRRRPARDDAGGRDAAARRLTELMFAGALDAPARARCACADAAANALPMHADADFC